MESAGLVEISSCKVGWCLDSVAVAVLERSFLEGNSSRRLARRVSKREVETLKCDGLLPVDGRVELVKNVEDVKDGVGTSVAIGGLVGRMSGTDELVELGTKFARVSPKVEDE